MGAGQHRRGTPVESYCSPRRWSSCRLYSAPPGSFSAIQVTRLFFLTIRTYRNPNIRTTALLWMSAHRSSLRPIGQRMCSEFMTIRILDQKDTPRHAEKTTLMQPTTPNSRKRSRTARATKRKKGVPNRNTAHAAMNHRGNRYVYSLSSNYSLKEGSPGSRAGCSTVPAGASNRHRLDPDHSRAEAVTPH